MQEQELASLILDRSSRSFDLEDIITEVCETSGLHWDKAEQLVKSVQAENERAIARRQFPLMFVVALIFFITGVLLSAYGVYGLYLFFTPQGGMPGDLTTIFVPVIEVGLEPLQALFLAIFAYIRLILYFLFSPFSATLLGGAMMVGSLMGMRKSWSAILP